MRTYNGKILIRIPPEVHRELATEAFESGRSMNQLCMEAILARRSLRAAEPWRSMEARWVTRSPRPAKPAGEKAEGAEGA